MLSRMKLRDDAEIRNYFGKKNRVIDIIVDLSKKDWEEPGREKEVNRLFEKVNEVIDVDEMTRDIWFTANSIEKIGAKKGWMENGVEQHYPSAEKGNIGKKHLPKCAERKFVEYKWAKLDTKGIIIQFDEDDGSTKKMWRINENGIKFVLILMSARYWVGGEEK